MRVISKIDADLVRRSVTQYISASQFDANARLVAVTLTADGQPWNPPADAAASVVFRNLQTGHKGRYDTMPDGSPACTVEGNVVTAILAPAVLAAAGEVAAAVVFQDESLNQIATFHFHIMVEANPESGEAIGNDYVNFTPGNIDDTSVGKQAWSSEKIVQELEKTKADSGAIVCRAAGETIAVNDASHKPLRGLTVYGKTTQTGTPSLDNPAALDSAGDDGGITVKVTGKNIFDVATAGMYHSNSATTQAVNNTVTETGVYMNPLIALSNPSQRCGLYIGTTKELAGKTVTVSAKVETTISMPWMLITATRIEPTTVRENPTYQDGGYIRSGESKTLKETKATDGFAKTTYTVTGNEDFPYISAIFYLGNTGAVTTEDWTQWSDIQVEIGDTATAYEPYKEMQRIAISTPDGLPGIPVSSGGNYTDENGQQWVCDEIDFAKGVVRTRIGYTDHYDDAGIPTDTYISSTGELSEGAQVYYLLDHVDEAPIPETLMDAYRMIHMNEPNTTVINDSAAGMTVSYVADTKVYIDNKFAELQKAILATGANV